MLELLLREGADVNILNDDHWSPLFFACQVREKWIQLWPNFSMSLMIHSWFTNTRIIMSLKEDLFLVIIKERRWINWPVHDQKWSEKAETPVCNLIVLKISLVTSFLFQNNNLFAAKLLLEHGADYRIKSMQGCCCCHCCSHSYRVRFSMAITTSMIYIIEKKY